MVAAGRLRAAVADRVPAEPGGGLAGADGLLAAMVAHDVETDPVSGAKPHPHRDHRPGSAGPRRGIPPQCEAAARRGDEHGELARRKRNRRPPSAAAAPAESGAGSPVAVGRPAAACSPPPASSSAAGSVSGSSITSRSVMFAAGVAAGGGIRDAAGRCGRRRGKASPAGSAGPGRSGPGGGCNSGDQRRGCQRGDGSSNSGHQVSLPL